MNKKNNYTAFIFARGGSKGVVDKNIRLVNGKPLIAYSIEAGLKSEHISNIIVSTDSDKIADVALGCGAQKIIKRPNELASDSASEILSWKHAIEMEKELFEGHQQPFISLPTTSPLRNEEDINNAFSAFAEQSPDVLFAISDSYRNPYLNMVEINEDNHLEIVIKREAVYQRQKAPLTYDISTAIYIANHQYVLNCESLMQGHVGYSKIPRQRALDIDEEYDLYLADLLLKYPSTSVSE